MKITDLRYGDLLDFHHKNYHPSNAKTFTYGNLPLVDTLKQLNEQFSGYGKRARKDKLLMPIDLKRHRCQVTGSNRYYASTGEADKSLNDVDLWSATGHI